MCYTWNWRECIRRSERESPRSRFARRFAQRLALSDALARSTCTEPLSHGKIAVGFVSSKRHDSIYNASSITAPFRSPKSERISLFKVKEFVRIFIGIRVWSERAEGTSRPAISLPFPLSLFIVWRRPKGRKYRLYPSFSLPLRHHRSIMVHPDRLLLNRLLFVSLCLSPRVPREFLCERVSYSGLISGKNFPEWGNKWGKQRN